MATTVERLVAFVLCVALPITAILTFQLLPRPYTLEIGQVAPQTIKAPDRRTFASQILTKQEREAVAARIEDVTKLDAAIAVQQAGKAAEALQAIGRVRDDIRLSPAQKRDALRQMPELKLSDRAIDAALGLDPAAWQAAVAETTRVLADTMRAEIRPERLNEEKGRIPGKPSSALRPEQTLVVGETVGAFVVANTFVDRAATEEARQAARNAVWQVRVTVEKGETIVRDGEIVKPLDIEKLEAVGLLNPDVGWGDIAGALMLSLAAVATIGAYLLMYLPRLLANNRRLLLLALILVVSVLAPKLIVPGREIYAYAFPLAAAPMLVAALLDVRLALLVSGVLAIFFGQVVGGQFELVVIQLVAGWVAALGVWRAERVMQFFLAGLAVALADCILFLGLSLSGSDLGLGRAAMFVFVFLAQGGLVSALTVGTFTILGYIFGIVTTIHLLELAHPNQPLLRRLSMEAPGTYHHSIVVANLAERAAELIGADSLLTRVGAYYHDIGKSLRPGNFIDNQIPGDNIHDQLDPEESSGIILAHVADGLRLARQHRVPARIRDFIAEHHGTRLVTYFYHRACQNGSTVDPDRYRYPGPRPQSRETAIVMLADSVEAAVRSCHDRSSERIDGLVDKIVAERLTEGELDECDLTIRDVHTIRDAFKTTLRGVYHPRVEYPERDRPTTPQLPPGRPAKAGS